LSESASAQTVRSHISEGNRVYDKSKYTDAEVEYKKALEKNPKSKEAQFNLEIRIINSSGTMKRCGNTVTLAFR